MFKSKLLWGGILLCGGMILFGILIHKADQSQETITIYKTVTPEQRVKSQSPDKLKAQTNDKIDETEIVSTPVDSDVSADTEDFTLEDTGY